MNEIVKVKMKERPTKDEYYYGIALAVSKRSTCLKIHYGSVIVNNDEIISTGYNGNPRGMENCCERGTCSRMKIVHNTGNYLDCFSVHSEQNAMLSPSRKEMIGGTLYIAAEEMDLDKSEFVELENAEPCPICKRMLKNAGIVRVVNKNGTVYQL